MWFRDKLDRLSQIKFYLWRLSGNRFEGSFRLKNGSVTLLRPKPFQDIAIATEVFVLEAYNIPACVKINSDTVHHIVDLGANVGYTCLYWLYKFPKANIVAFEPHPNHVKQILKHLEVNCYTSSVKLFPKAAGIENEELYLTDEEFSSELVDAPAKGTIKVEVVDWITEIGDQAIDLLKMDIEGSEYILLSDTRFSRLNIPVCVIEWHNTEKYSDGRMWCEKRLNELGYQFCEGKAGTQTNGLLWAWKS